MLSVSAVLSVSVSAVLSASVEGAMEYRMRDNDVFRAVSLSGMMWSSMLVPLEKTASGGNASFWPANPCVAHFLDIQLLPVHVL